MTRTALVIKLSEGYNWASCASEGKPVAKKKLPFAHPKKQLFYISPLLSDPGDTQDVCFLSSFKHVLRWQASLRGKRKNGF